MWLILAVVALAVGLLVAVLVEQRSAHNDPESIVTAPVLTVEKRIPFVYSTMCMDEIVCQRILANRNMDRECARYRRVEEQIAFFVDPPRTNEEWHEFFCR